MDETPSCSSCKSWRPVSSRIHEASAGICQKIIAASVVVSTKDAVVSGGESHFRTGADFYCNKYIKVGSCFKTA